MTLIHDVTIYEEAGAITPLQPLLSAAQNVTTLVANNGGYKATLSTTVENTKYGFRCPFSAPVDISANKYFMFQYYTEQYWSDRGAKALAEGGFRVLIYDINDSYVEYYFWGKQTLTEGLYHYANLGTNASGICVVDTTSTPDSSAGTIDLTHVAGIEIHSLRDRTGSYGFVMVVGRIVGVNLRALTGNASIADFNALTTNSSIYNYNFWSANPHEFMGANGVIYSLAVDFSIGDGVTQTVVNDSSFYLAWYPARSDAQANNLGRVNSQAGGRKMVVNQSATDIVILSGVTISGRYDSEWLLEVTGSISGACTFNNGIFYRPHSVSMNHGNFNNVSIYDAGVIDINNGDLTDSTFGNCNEIVLNTSVTFIGCTINNNVNASAKGLTIALAPGDYSAIDVLFADNTAGRDIEISPTIAGTYDLSGLSVKDGQSLKIHNTSATLAITVILPAGMLNTPTTAGGITTIAEPATSGTVAAPAILDGSRCCLQNITQASTIDNRIVSGGTGYSITVNLGVGELANSGDVIQLKICKQSGVNAWLPLLLGGVITSGGVIFIDSQKVDEKHDAYGVDGSTVTELTADFANIQIDIADPDGVFDSRRAIAWWRYICQTELGIAQYDPFAIEYNPDIRNILVNGPLQIENVNLTLLKITEGLWTRLDGQSLIATTSNTIHWIPDDRVYQGPETGVSGLTSSESTKLLALPNNPLLTDDARLDNLDAAISSRLATAGYTAPDNTGVLVAIAALNDLSAVDLNNLSILEVQTMLDGLTSPDNITIASIAAAVTALNDLSSPEVQTLLDGVPDDVLAAAQATPIHADTKKMNGANVLGVGSETDKWRGA